MSGIQKKKDLQIITCPRPCFSVFFILCNKRIILFSSNCFLSTRAKKMSEKKYIFRITMVCWRKHCQKQVFLSICFIDMCFISRNSSSNICILKDISKSPRYGNSLRCSSDISCQFSCTDESFFYLFNDVSLLPIIHLY